MPYTAQGGGAVRHFFPCTRGVSEKLELPQKNILLLHNPCLVNGSGEDMEKHSLKIGLFQVVRPGNEYVHTPDTSTGFRSEAATNTAGAAAAASSGTVPQPSGDCVSSDCCNV